MAVSDPAGPDDRDHAQRARRRPLSAKLSEQSVMVLRALAVDRADAHARAHLRLPEQLPASLRERVLDAGWNEI